jgi:hypothetical protein
MEASGRRHGAHSYGTKLPRSSAIGFFEGAIGIDSIRSWSRVVRQRAATFAATALAGPSSRTWHFAHARSLIAAHQLIRIADEALSVASAVAVARRLTPSVRTVDPLPPGRIRGPPRCANTQSASCLRHGSHGSPLHVLHGAPQCGAAFSDLPSHV